MTTTRLVTIAAAAMFGLAALGNVFTIAAPANASTTTTAVQIAQQPTGTDTGQPFSGDPYPESNPFPSLPGNPYSK
ncbi:MAG: hypothetical protein JO280_11175 [Mycobacteriaceae bacterium]|nr:hypothetical protein [Mycobacteriaceae bacterium]